MNKIKGKKNRNRTIKPDYSKLKCPFKSPDEISYKDVYKLKKFVTTRGRIISRTRTGVCLRCQRKLVKEIKKARYMALLPFTEYS